MTQNQIAYKNAKELERHNKATEAENERHAKMSEALQNWSNAIQKYQVAVNNLHYTRMDNETARSNRAREQQNLLTLQETMRSNVANEDIRRQQNAISAAANSIQRMQAQETSRHNVALESLQKTLNESTIEKQQAEASYASENASYTRERATTQRAETSRVWAQEANLRMDTSLKSAQINTEASKQVVNIMSGINQGSQAATNVLKVLVPSGSSGGSNAWKEVDKALGL